MYTLLKQKREKRRAKENFRISKTNENWNVFKSKTLQIYFRLQYTYLTEKFTSCKGYIKKIYKLIDDLSKCNTKSIPYPEEDPEIITTNFDDFFKNKMKNIRNDIQTTIYIC